MIEKYECFMNICVDLTDKYVPKVEYVVGKGKPKWMTRKKESNFGKLKSLEKA